MDSRHNWIEPRMWPPAPFDMHRVALRVRVCKEEHMRTRGRNVWSKERSTIGRVRVLTWN